MGLFITFEGPDGCGKTSIMNLIKEYYKSNEKIIFTVQGYPVSLPYFFCKDNIFIIFSLLKIDIVKNVCYNNIKKRFLI